MTAFVLSTLAECKCNGVVCIELLQINLVIILKQENQLVKYH